MWLLFDRNGKLTKQVEYEKLAYLTSTNFYLFCVFEGLNLENLGLAHLSLRKPSGDFIEFEVSGTLLTKRFIVPNKKLENSYLPFVDGQDYAGANFDFSQSGFLDEIGLWKGTITFYTNNGTRNLTGLFTFMVQPSVVQTQNGPVTYDEYILLLGEIAQKQNHLTAGKNVSIVNGVISATGGGGGGEGGGCDCPDLTNYVTFDSLYAYHDSTKQNVINAANKLPIEFIEGDIQTVTKLSELENDMNFVTKSYVDRIIPDEYDDTAIKLRLNKIEGVIPAQANELNELADKDFVNSSISTATATFKGTFNNLTELQQTSADMNDYAYFKHTDDNDNTVYSKYKYSDGAWSFEYDLNTTGFTAAQWATINSGLTASSIPTNYITTDTEQDITALKRFEQIPVVKFVQETHDLPSGYTELEYILNDGTQYIDTGIEVSKDNRGTFKLEIDGNFGGGNIWRIDGSAYPYQHCYIGFNNLGVLYYGMDTDISVGYVEQDLLGRHTYVIDYYHGLVSRDDVVLKTFTTTTSTKPAHNLFIFGWAAEREKQNGSRKYSVKIYQYDVLVAEMYPAKQNSTGKIGLYDKIRNQFFSSATSYNLLAGPEITGARYVKLLCEGNFAVVASTGSYTDLLDKPTIPSKTSQLTNDSNFLTKTNGDSYYQAKGDYALKSELPTIPTKVSELTNDSDYATQENVQTAIDNIPSAGFEDILEGFIGRTKVAWSALNVSEYGSNSTYNGTALVPVMNESSSSFWNSGSGQPLDVSFHFAEKKKMATLQVKCPPYGGVSPIMTVYYAQEGDTELTLYKEIATISTGDRKTYEFNEEGISANYWVIRFTASGWIDLRLCKPGSSFTPGLYSEVFHQQIMDKLNGYQPVGNYALKSEIPTVPTKVSQLQNDSNFLSLVNGILSGVEEISNSSNRLVINPYTSFDSGVDMCDNVIKSVATPVEDSDAATKKYVDDAIATYMSTHYDNGNTGSY